MSLQNTTNLHRSNWRYKRCIPVAQRATNVCACLRRICLAFWWIGSLVRKCSMKSWGVTEARSHFSLFRTSSSICCEEDMKVHRLTYKFLEKYFYLFTRHSIIRPLDGVLPQMAWSVPDSSYSNLGPITNDNHLMTDLEIVSNKNFVDQNQ